jgi:hypothetical protein
MVVQAQSRTRTATQNWEDMDLSFLSLPYVMTPSESQALQELLAKLTCS